LTFALFSAISIATVLLAGSFAFNLLNDIYAGRRQQYATLIALGLSPAIAITPAVAFGLALGAVSVLVGGAAAAPFVPRPFAMPSLMADLGPTEPRMDWVVAGSMVAIAIAAVFAGLVSTVFRLVRRPIAMSLPEVNP